jgi:membrane protease YdiL (CAAX protease family)
MVKQFISSISIIDVIIFLPGLILFSIWLIRTSLGKKALVDSKPRPNDMPVYLPLIPLLIWFGVVGMAVSIIDKLLADLPDWQSAFLDNLILCIGAIVTMPVIIFLARGSFAGRLKGFGLNVKTIHRDLFAGVINLLAVSPIVIAAIIVTALLGALIWGKDFEIQQHRQLELIATHPQLPLRVLIIITAVAIVPVFEEMLFREIFQTMIRSFFETRISKFETRTGACPVRNELQSRTGPALARTSNGVWLSIVISSGLFATFHANAGHWPALFVLAICLGYAYEKGGSLFRPIFIHCLFNATAIIAALYQ